MRRNFFFIASHLCWNSWKFSFSYTKFGNTEQNTLSRGIKFNRVTRDKKNVFCFTINEYILCPRFMYSGEPRCWKFFKNSLFNYHTVWLVKFLIMYIISNKWKLSRIYAIFLFPGWKIWYNFKGLWIMRWYKFYFVMLMLDHSERYKKGRTNIFFMQCRERYEVSYARKRHKDWDWVGPSSTYIISRKAFDVDRIVKILLPRIFQDWIPEAFVISTHS